ncbi:hypothetical protein CTAYLR_006621 [Chrysophaeum taylorii]|uniref:WW domain-containing protein n=1 Tax=Chrysophaeum taylorii TaxID=2483200 RepID=A0AAD7UMT0_9STRA|nr:hypothetical protein CTAYLR_006621 [Chrysophaeum taylorii]
MGRPNLKHALSAIARAESTSASALPFDDIPAEIMSGQHLDLRAWSMLFSEKTAKAVAAITRARELRRVEEHLKFFKPTFPGAPVEEEADDGFSSGGGVLGADRARRMARREAFAEKLREVEEAARRKALRVAQDELGVREILIGGASELTDDGVSELAAACPAVTTVDISGASRVTDVGLRALAVHCRNLRQLNVGGCAGLCGPGLAALGERCKQLVSMRLARCGRAATGWALAAFVKGCGQNLTTLDASHCLLLNDADCNSIAKYCPSLTWLSLADSRQVGDVGVVAIGNGCQSLQKLSLARSELPHRLTDIALLSVAEGCGHALRDLDLRGCEMVTDVGVSWIAHQTGASLTTINLRGCNRVGNGGCRALAENCRALRRIDLHGARRVTDVGIRVLGASLGSVLESLDCSYMHLLSDGTDRGFGFEGLLALARDATALMALHLDGCFQVSTRVLTALSKAHIELRELGLAGCPRLTTAALGLITTANGRTLEKLNFACCGDCIDDAAVSAVARGAPRLRHLILRDCERWGQVGAQAIARHCRRLARLDCSGCKSVDDYAVAHIANAQFDQLRHVILAHCPKFGDIGLAWLAEGPGGADLVTLALFKTCCTTAALKSYRGHFVYSELRRDDDFFGFKPKPRWEHRVTIHHHAKKRNAVIHLQSTYRALCDRRRVKEMQERRALDLAFTQLQKMWRGALGRRFVAMLRARLVLEANSAVTLQCFVRCTVARSLAQSRRKAIAYRVATVAAIQIEKCWRGFVCRRYVRRLVWQVKEQLRRRKSAAKFLQRNFRGYLGRRRAAARWRERTEERARQELAAGSIQRRMRVAAARSLAKQARAARTRQELEKHKAAVLVQARVRRYRTSLIVVSRRSIHAARVRAAVSVQSLWRARHDRLLVYVAAAERRHKVEFAAAATIQRGERVRCAKRELASRQVAARNLWRRHTAAATVAQGYARGWLARKFAARLRTEHLDHQRKLAELRSWASTLIAAGWRGKRGRDRAYETLNQRRARWKEMFDEDTQRPFFFNQVTGEIRWRRPQDLLELMKRPLCSNCAYFEAALECAACEEFFCHECWHQVHYGGKRAAHPFRSLYDAYGMRVDYGDGEFESRWPSEIIQDDVNGILLRISPHREPVEVVGAWQRYEDPDYGTSFYYNPISGEGTYTPPQAFLKKAMSPYQLARAQSIGEIMPPFESSGGTESDLAGYYETTVASSYSPHNQVSVQ